MPHGRDRELSLRPSKPSAQSPAHVLARRLWRPQGECIYDQGTMKTASWYQGLGRKHVKSSLASQLDSFSSLASTAVGINCYVLSHPSCGH